MDAVESCRLHGCVVNHVLEDDFVADVQLAGEEPGTHEVAGKA